MIINVKIDDGAYMPEKAHETDGGFDLRTPSRVVVLPHDSVNIDTGIHVQIPNGFTGLIVSKSGLNCKSNLTSTGLIDCGYTGSIVVHIYNNGDEPYVFQIGDKITQLVIMPIPSVEIVEVDDLGKTDRSDNGFGSSGR